MNERRNARKLKAKSKKVFNKGMQFKLRIVLFVVLFCFIFLIGRIVYIYNTKGVKYSNAVLSHLSYVGSTIPYQRGTITDRNGVVLAECEQIYNIIIDPSLMFSLKDESLIKPTLDALVQSFGFNYDELHSRLYENQTKKYLILGKGYSYEEMHNFEKLAAENKDIKGVWFELEHKRVYPYGSLASHVIGYTNAGNVGTYGIEQQYNDFLNGIDGRSFGYYDNELNLVETKIDPQNGATVVSTIDTFAQSIVEDEIKKFLDQYNVKNIAVLLMDPNSGAIYAMASNKGFDLNDPRDLTKFYSQQEIFDMSDEERTNALNKIWRNYAICDTYEPGSTYKLITVAGALEENAITTDDEVKYNCPGLKQVGIWKIRCSNRWGHGELTITQGIEYSCNCVLMDVAEKMGTPSFIKYQKMFNFGQKTGIDLPGEATGILLDDKQMGVAELATSSFGQSFNVTMVQMAAAYSSLINGGYYYQPHVVERVVDSRGVTVYNADDTLMKVTVSKETSDYMRHATQMVVEEGTASLAMVEGYKVGGKTGTAQKGNRDDDLFVVSFIGSVPADNPQLVSYVVVDQLDDPLEYNTSHVASKLTSDILSRVLAHLGIFPSEGDVDYHVGEFRDEVNEGLDVIEDGDAENPDGDDNNNGDGEDNV